MDYFIFVSKVDDSLPWVIWCGATFHKASRIESDIGFRTVDRKIDDHIARYVLLVNGCLTFDGTVAKFTKE